MLDSNLLRYIAVEESGFDNIRQRIADVGVDHCFLSAVAVFELQASVRNIRLTKAERADLARLIGYYKVLPFGKRAASEAGKIKAALVQQGKQAGEVDMMIAGHALSIGAAVATRNLKHFDRIPGLTVENWLKPRI